MPEKNNDFDVPKVKGFDYGPVFIGNFESDVPIFWGPGQLTVGFPAYYPPDPEKWRKFEHLNIPKVVRFIYAAQDEYDPNYQFGSDTGVTNVIWQLLGYTFGEHPKIRYEYQCLNAPIAGLLNVLYRYTSDPYSFNSSIIIDYNVYPTLNAFLPDSYPPSEFP